MNDIRLGIPTLFKSRNVQHHHQTNQKQERQSKRVQENTRCIINIIINTGLKRDNYRENSSQDHLSWTKKRPSCRHVKQTAIRVRHGCTLRRNLAQSLIDYVATLSHDPERLGFSVGPTPQCHVHWHWIHVVGSARNDTAWTHQRTPPTHSHNVATHVNTHTVVHVSKISLHYVYNA